MVDFRLKAAPTLGGVDLTFGSNRVTERSELAIVSVATPLAGEAALSEALRSGWGLAMPDPTQSESNGQTRAIRTAPDQILLMFPWGTHDAEPMVQGKLNGAGHTTDQTDTWVVLEVSGPDTLAALERLCPLDIASFSVGASARTIMEHMGALIVRLDSDRFLLMSANSSAKSFLHAVEVSFRNVL